MGLPIIGDIVKTVGEIVDDLHTSGEEKNENALKKLELLHDQLKGQQEITKAEASHSSVFVAGGRPFIIWVSGCSIAYQFILYPLLLWGWAVAGNPSEPPPPMDASTLMTLVLSMLGVGTMRSFDKVRGVDTKRIKPKKIKRR